MDRRSTWLLVAALAIACTADPSQVAPLAVTPEPTLQDAPAAAVSTAYIGVVRPRLEIDVAAPRPGRVLEVFVEVGDGVAPGMPIARFDDAALVDEAERLQALQAAAHAEEALARATRRAAARELDKSRSLAQRGTIARGELDEARLAAEQARAQVEAAHARVREIEAQRAIHAHAQIDALVRAPWPAWVAARSVDPGASVAAGRPLVRLVSRELAIAFAMPATEAGALGRGARARVEGDHGVLASDRPVVLAPEVDPASGMRFASVLWPADADELAPGTVVTVRIEGAT